MKTFKTPEAYKKYRDGIHMKAAAYGKAMKMVAKTPYHTVKNVFGGDKEHIKKITGR